MVFYMGCFGKKWNNPRLLTSGLHYAATGRSPDRAFIKLRCVSTTHTGNSWSSVLGAPQPCNSTISYCSFPHPDQYTNPLSHIPSLPLALTSVVHSTSRPSPPKSGPLLSRILGSYLKCHLKRTSRISLR